MNILTNSDYINGNELQELNPSLFSIRVDKKSGKVSLNDIFDMFGIDKTNRNRVYVRLKNKYPDLFDVVEILKINSIGKETRVIDASSAIALIWYLPGKYAIDFRRKSAEYVTRLLVGDRTLINEIEITNERTNNDLQTTVLNNLDTPDLPSITTQELHNIIERQKNEMKIKEQALEKALLETDNMNQKYIKMQDFSYDYKNKCERILSYSLQPLDKVVSKLAGEVTNYLDIELKDKVDELECDYRGYINDKFKKDSIDRLSEKNRLQEKIIEKLSKKAYKDPNKLNAKLTQITKSFYDRIEREIKDDLADSRSRAIKAEKKLKKLKTTTVENCSILKGKLKELDKVDEYQEQIACLTREINNLKKTNKQTLREYGKLKKTCNKINNRNLKHTITRPEESETNKEKMSRYSHNLLYSAGKDKQHSILLDDLWSNDDEDN